jgi:hypothetical protein
MERHAAAVARNDITRFGRGSRELHLDALEGGVHGAGGSARTRLLGQHIPRFERLAELEFDSSGRDGTDLRKAKFIVRREPFVLETVAGIAQVGKNIMKVALDKMG